MLGFLPYLVAYQQYQAWDMSSAYFMEWVEASMPGSLGNKTEFE